MGKYMQVCGSRGEKPTAGAFEPRAFAAATYASKVSLPLVGGLMALRKHHRYMTQSENVTIQKNSPNHSRPQWPVVLQ